MTTSRTGTLELAACTVPDEAILADLERLADNIAVWMVGAR